MGGRGLRVIYDCYRQECTSLAEYLQNSTDVLTKTTALLSRQIDSRTKTILRFLDAPHNAAKDKTDQEHHRSLLEKPLHGNFFIRQAELPTLDKEQSRSWLAHAGLRRETESLLCAAQEQALPTMATRARIYGEDVSPMCRFCHNHQETVHHLVSGCTMLAGTKYKHRHDTIAKYIHWCLLKEHGAPHCPNWLQHKPEHTCVTDKVDIYWDVPLLTDRKVGHNRPDITIHNHNDKTCLFYEITIPVDANTVKATSTKISKYRDLAIEIQKCWNVKKVTTVPIVIGALGTTLVGLKASLKYVKHARINELQKTTLLGTANILRHCLF